MQPWSYTFCADLSYKATLSLRGSKIRGENMIYVYKSRTAAALLTRGRRWDAGQPVQAIIHIANVPYILCSLVAVGFPSCSGPNGTGIVLHLDRKTLSTNRSVIFLSCWNIIRCFEDKKVRLVVRVVET